MLYDTTRNPVTTELVMALPKKNSRTIMVNGTRYRWICSESFRDLPKPYVIGDGSVGRVNLTIENDESGGSQIRLSDIQILESHYRPERIYTPKLVRRLIEYAINSGWTPEGGDFEIEDSSCFVQE